MCCCKHVKLDSGWWVIKAAGWSGANINSSSRSSWTRRREEWQHDAQHSVPQPHEGDGARAVSDGASGGFLCTAPGLRVPSAERPGEKPGAHRWLALLQGESSFRELAGKVRGQKKHLNAALCIYTCICMYRQTHVELSDCSQRQES